MSAFAELLATSHFTFLTGGSGPRELVEQAAALGLSAIGICDVNTLGGVVRAHEAAAELDIQLCVGAELHLMNGFKLACYPTDKVAYSRLTRLLTTGKMRAPKGECHLYPEDVAAFAKGQIFILIPPEGDDPHWLDQAKEIIRLISEFYGVYLALSPCVDGEDGARFVRLSRWAAELGLKTIATNRPLYHVPSRKPLADVLTCIREKCTIDEAGYRLNANAEAYIKNGAQLSRIMTGYEDAIARAAEVARQITFSLTELEYQYPHEILKDGETAQESLERLTWEGAHRRYGETLPLSVQKALAYELRLVGNMDFAPYFLTVHDIVDFARNRAEPPILCQGRGSAANSAVCYCLGVTEVDPAKNQLLFERFISEERGEPPDIDIDFEHERREEVIQYVYQKYGRLRAGLTATVVTYRARGAIRDVGKALGLSTDTISALAKTTWGWSAKGIDPKHVEEELGLNLSDHRLRLAIILARQLQGFPRHVSQHPGGFVITQDRLDDLVPIANAAMDDRTVIEWNKDDIETLKMLKVDLLGLGMLSAIAYSFGFLKDAYGEDWSIPTIPPEDPSVYDMICEADTVGVFQIESRAQMTMLPRLKPRTFYDLVIEVAIVRPGPIQGDMVHPYLLRRDGKEHVTYPSEDLKGVLHKTLGVPLFQEQAMSVAIVGAGFTPSEADQLRRAMATFRNPGTIKYLSQRFIDGMINNGYTPEFAERCFQQISGFGEYGFPESHAASFAILVYVSCWLKHYCPDVFLAAMLNAQPLGFYAPAQLVRDAIEHGVEVRPPDVNHSDWDATLERREECDERGRKFAVRVGLRQVKGLAEAAGARIMSVREAEGRFTRFDDLIHKARLDRGALEALARADACRSMGEDRREALWAAHAKAHGDLPLFSGGADYGEEGRAQLPVMSGAEHVMHDYAHLHLSLKAHPISFLRETFTAQRVSPCADLLHTADGRWISVAGLVLARQRPGTASGVIFITLEDEGGIANLVVWPKVFDRYRPVVMGARMMRVFGKVQREGKVIHVIARQIWDETWRLGELARGADVRSGFDAAAGVDEVKNPGADPRIMAAKRKEARTRAESVLPRSRDFH